MKNTHGKIKMRNLTRRKVWRLSHLQISLKCAEFYGWESVFRVLKVVVRLDTTMFSTRLASWRGQACNLGNSTTNQTRTRSLLQTTLEVWICLLGEQSALVVWAETWVLICRQSSTFFPTVLFESHCFIKSSTAQGGKPSTTRTFGFAPSQPRPPCY